MNREEIKEQLQVIVAKVVKLESVTLNDETTANDVEGWDSLSHMEIITEIEKSFNISFKLRELSKLKNVGSIIDLISKKQ
ncbi:acyl carrier protein [Gammaproteobacteria bacterium]|nr:acyl carrier protein [Gammaproteobacteria bacterium]